MWLSDNVRLSHDILRTVSQIANWSTFMPSPAMLTALWTLQRSYMTNMAAFSASKGAAPTMCFRKLSLGFLCTHLAEHSQGGLLRNRCDWCKKDKAVIGVHRILYLHEGLLWLVPCPVSGCMGRQLCKLARRHASVHPCWCVNLRPNKKALIKEPFLACSWYLRLVEWAELETKKGELTVRTWSSWQMESQKRRAGELPWLWELQDRRSHRNHSDLDGSLGNSVVMVAELPEW